MRSTSLRRILTAAALTVATSVLLTGPAGAATVALVEDWDQFPRTVWADGTLHGAWRAVYDGYGTTGITRTATYGNVLYQRPAASTSKDETHGSMVVTRATYSGDIDLSVRLRTVKQLRTPTPNPWEVAWISWHYTHDEHFYYFIPKPNGWELGKVDNTKIDPDGPECVWPTYLNCKYEGAQRYLATSSTTKFRVGPWYNVRVQQVGSTIRVWVNGRWIVTHTDTNNPYDRGSVGLYNEDADVRFDQVRITTL